MYPSIIIDNNFILYTFNLLGGIYLKLQINDKYLITSDKHNIILNQRKEKGEKSKDAGEVHFVPVKFVRTLEDALNTLLDLEVNDSDLEGLKELTERLETIRNDIHDSLRRM